MDSFCFHLEGVSVRIQGPEDVLDRLRLDFAAFAESRSTPDIELGLELNHKISPRARTRIQGLGPDRQVHYAKGVLARSWFAHGVRHFAITGAKVSDLCEIAYFAVMSALGEVFDRQGLHRVHGLAFEFQNSAYLAVGASGSGKSSLAAFLTSRPLGVRLFSDECPLLRANEVRPFPIRLALNADVAQTLKLHGLATPRQKTRVPFPLDQLASPRPVGHLLLLRAINGPPYLQKASRLSAAFYLIRYLVIGIGLQQMAEWLLRRDTFLPLTRVAWSRLKTAARLIHSAERIDWFFTSRDAIDNGKSLEQFLMSATPDPRVRWVGAQELLRLAERLSRGSLFAPFHRAVARVYRGPLVRFLTRRLRESTGVEIDLRPRHSVLSDRFNAFRSDLDLTAIVPNDCVQSDRRRLHENYERWRQRLPFLGELEVYSKNEQALLEEVNLRHGPILQAIRNLRKWHWLDSIRYHASTYHAKKSIAARENLQREILERDLNTALHDLWILGATNTEILSPIEFRSAYLGWKVTTQAPTDFRTGTLGLDPDAARALCAILPDQPETADRFRPGIRELRHDLILQESVVCLSLQATSDRDSREIKKWLNQLRALQDSQPEAPL